MYTRAGEEATSAFKGRLAARYFDMASGVATWTPPEDEPAPVTTKGNSELKRYLSVTGGVFFGGGEVRSGASPLRQETEDGEKGRVLMKVSMNDEDEDEDFFGGLGEALDGLGDESDSEPICDGEEDEDLFECMGDAMGELDSSDGSDDEEKNEDKNLASNSQDTKSIITKRNENENENEFESDLFGGMGSAMAELKESDEEDCDVFGGMEDALQGLEDE
jgi:hypothetical protein